MRLEWHGEQLDRLIDAGHASLVDMVVDQLRSCGWECVAEATFSVYGERGSIDILAFHPEAGVLLVVEVKTTIPEIGNLLAPLDRKVRLAPRVADERGWAPIAVARLLVVADTSTNRRRIDAHRATFASTFPVRGWEARRWLAHPEPVRGWSGLWISSGDRQETRATR